ncbi:hypothetical protein RIR_jg17205.t1 [Rhizophagus irregularis DAOM 181602=DAOM 197198]|uniref:Uncharacterized protein n=1 Tax=Rhizophagus irregularis (strain DAOM 181602 / DAOM 197198 / MUCL 43194) TaxID=747089 RepID=U9TGB6_RHIID|nr:hypothetical protein RIR_jg17205.t1 [Rhizophagus irregularis DAOM 181602=DAOM 197198]
MKIYADPNPYVELLTTCDSRPHVLHCIKKKLLIFLINRNFNFFELYCGVVAFKMNVSKKELKICIVKDNRKDIIKTVQAYYTSFMCGCKLIFQAVHGENGFSYFNSRYVIETFLF